LAGAAPGGVSRPPESLSLESKGFHPLFDLAEHKLPSVNTCIDNSLVQSAVDRGLAR
jgi:hypothetical protein